MRSRVPAIACAVAVFTWLPVVAAPAAHAANPIFTPARDAAPVVLTGAQIPAWAAPPAEGVAAPQPSGAGDPNPLGDHVRSAHNGILTVPPTPPGIVKVDPDRIAAYRWTGSSWGQIPVQVDQRFPYFLANGHSDFGVYSGTDEELTYAWNPDSHDVGEEAWKKVFGQCDARYELPGAAGDAEYAQAVHDGAVTPPTVPGISADDYRSAMQDPQTLFDTDDELSFMARDAGQLASPPTPPPAGTANGQVVSITDPVDPGSVGYVYLFTRPGGSSYKATQSTDGHVGSNGYVDMQRDANADQWNDRYAYNDNDPLKIGTSNTGYGPNIPGTVCHTASDYTGSGAQFAGVSDGDPRSSTDRTPLDGMTVTTPTYRLHADGRWLVRDLQVTKPGTTGDYGPDIIARWKGRAFQQSPNSSVSLVGFEDEQVNWEMNSALLGWRVGPVRAIREIWGADSGTNVTKTEYYYRDADVFNYHVRVHPIPPDGLYTDWDYRLGMATRYYNLNSTDGVPVDGVPDSNVGEVDSVPVTGQDVETNVCDPTTQLCSAIDAPEEVAGPGFGLVYEFELTGATNLAGNFAVVPYYRDDACFDDGTGDSPVQRPFPGDAITDTGSRVEKAYIANAIANGAPADLTWDELVAECHKYANAAPWGRYPFQGAIAEHGLHFLVTQDSDNAFGPKSVDEMDGQQWRFEVPMGTPTNVLKEYGVNVSAKLVAAVAPYGELPVGAPSPSLPEVPVAVLLPAIGALVLWLVVRRRRRTEETPDSSSDSGPTS
jgi:hypothetical protein